MNCRVVYYSRTGNTRRVAEAIAQAVGCEAESVDRCRITEGVDLLFLGGAVYATYQHNYHPAIRHFLKDLDKTRVRKIAVFATYAFSSSIGKLIDLASSAGFLVTSESFACKGRFLLFNLRHPDAAEIDRAKEFANHLAGNAR